MILRRNLSMCRGGFESGVKTMTLKCTYVVRGNWEQEAPNVYFGPGLAI